MQISRKKHHFKFKNKLTWTKHTLKYGSLGFKIIKCICIIDKQEEFLKLLIIKTLKKITNSKGKILFYSNQFYNKTKLPLESRMGKGKGEIICSFSYYKTGFILFELKGFDLIDALKLKTYLNNKKIIKFSLIY
uniref:ribosomal protein L16 n=1 Tax=Polysiphonia morrowii TaxID=173542 RepID=UPI002E76C411|nr:ribosomal protein L16 [Polysiphonia morrowii]WQF69598.1 ribosomal protein L16 [Polysiphonia morrowii]